jgi:hypothetical protein
MANQSLACTGAHNEAAAATMDDPAKPMSEVMIPPNPMTTTSRARSWDFAVKRIFGFSRLSPVLKDPR